jgi:hypothetical protein
MIERRYPLFIEVFKGEGRYLIIPSVDHIGGFGVLSNNVIIKGISTGECDLGQEIINAAKFIKNSELCEKSAFELNKNPVWKSNTKYKSKVSFEKNNSKVWITITEDGDYTFHSWFWSSIKKEYADIINTIELVKPQKAELIGIALIEAFKMSEEYIEDDITLCDAYISLEMLDGNKISFYAPDDDHFTDEQDAHAAEIYQAYSYATNEGDDPFAYMYLGIAAELNCNISKEHIESVWTRLYGEPTSFSVKEGEFGIFTHRAEFKNKDNRVISYLKQMSDDLLLDCTLVIESPGRHTRAIKTLVKAHDKLMSDCKFIV